MKRRVLASLLFLLAFSLIVVASLIAFAPFGNSSSDTTQATTRQPTVARLSPTPTPTLQPILTVQGPPPTLGTMVSYLIDMDTGHVLEDSNGEKPVPMASTTKIMTALIAIQTGNLDRPIMVKQDAIDRVGYTGFGGSIGSSAHLQVGEMISLKDLLYALMLPSGDDAATAIADGLAGTTDQFVQRMNLFAYHLHLFQTHYVNPDGLTADTQNQDHYTTAADLTRLAEYAMKIPLFAQVVSTPSYSIPATAQHQAHTWTTTNELLTNQYAYPGADGIKTGTTDAAGACLVFAAAHNGHHLVGTLLHSVSSEQRFADAKALLDWGFALPLLAPNS